MAASSELPPNPDGPLVPEKAVVSRGYILAAIAAVAAGVVTGQLLVDEDVTYKVMPEVSVFAVLYVLAQGVERIVEFVISVLSMAIKGFAENKKRAQLSAINSTLNGNPTVDDIEGLSKKQAAVAEARTEITVLAQGLAFGMAYALVSYLEFGIFKAIGVAGFEPGLDRVLTAIAVMGGSKGLHELIGRLQKSKEAAKTA